MSWPMVSPLRQRMIDDIRARKLGRHSLRSHIHSCKRFAAFLKGSPETATADDVRRFQLTLIEEEGLTICNRNRIMTGVKFLLRVTMRRHDLAGGTERRRGKANSIDGAEPQSANHADDQLWLRPAGGRSHAVDGR